jgi:YegS/Rv2252/BmrU family lipid kinase
MIALVIYNEYSRKGKKLNIDYICNELKKKYNYVNKYRMISKEDNYIFLKNNVDKYDLLVVAGGDGTIDEIVNIIATLKTKPAIAIIPTGTCNDMANNLCMPKSLKKTMKVILNNKVEKYNLYKVNEKYFIYGLASGLVSDASYKAQYKNKKYFGKLAYYFKALTNIKNSKYLNLIISADNKIIEGTYSVLLCINSNYLAGFKLKLNTNDKLKLVLIKKTNRFIEVMNLAMFLICGEKYKKNITYIDATNIEIISNDSLDINTDGEYIGSFNKFNISIIKNALTIINNKD